MNRMSALYNPETFLSEFRSVRIDHCLSDERLTYLGRIGLSLHSLSALLFSDLERERDSIRALLDNLFAECHRRCLDSHSLSRLSLLVPLLYELGRSSFFPVRNGKVAECDLLACRLFSLWRGETFCCYQEQHGFLRAVLEWRVGMESCACEREPFFRYYRNVLSAWVHALSSDYTWPDISLPEAFGRLELLCLHSTELPDASYDALIPMVYARYKQLLEHETVIPVKILSSLPVLETNLPQSCADEEMIAFVRRIALSGLSEKSRGKDDYWCFLSVLCSCFCVEEFETYCAFSNSGT